MSDPNTVAREALIAEARRKAAEVRGDLTFLGELPPGALFIERFADALEQAGRALEQEREATHRWRTIIADTIVGLRATNASPEQIAGALERVQAAALELEALASSPGEPVG